MPYGDCIRLSHSNLSKCVFLLEVSQCINAYIPTFRDAKYSPTDLQTAIERLNQRAKRRTQRAVLCITCSQRMPTLPPHEGVTPVMLFFLAVWRSVEIVRFLSNNYGGSLQHADGLVFGELLCICPANRLKTHDLATQNAICLRAIVLLG